MVLYYEQLIKGYVCQRHRKKFKIHCKDFNAIYVKGDKRNSKYTVRAVMLCMLKVLKKTQNTM